MVTQKVQKVPKLFKCICCDYTSIRNSQYERHILTAKHIKMANDNKNVQESSNKYKCECGNIYTNRHNLSRHKKACKINNTETITDSYNIVNSTSFNLYQDRDMPHSGLAPSEHQRCSRLRPYGSPTRIEIKIEISLGTND